MNISNGVDIVDVERLRKILTTWPRFEERVFTPLEREYAASKRRPEQHLAARFAAKEATFKALGSGWPSISHHDVEVISTASGPRLRITGKAAALMKKRASAVSLSHDGGFAVAQVILEGDEQ